LTLTARGRKFVIEFDAIAVAFGWGKFVIEFDAIAVAFSWGKFVIFIGGSGETLWLRILEPWG